MLCFAAAVCIFASSVKLGAQNACFAVHVRLNGHQVTGPQMLTFKSKDWEKAAPAEGDCIRVPPSVLELKSVDVSFVVSGNSLSLSAIPTALLTGPWDIDLADRHFGRDVVLPKHAHAKNVCAVVFHVGEPETAATFTGCRTPF